MLDVYEDMVSLVYWSVVFLDRSNMYVIKI